VPWLSGTGCSRTAEGKLFVDLVADGRRCFNMFSTGVVDIQSGRFWSALR